jgi:hypothetical protein
MPKYTVSREVEGETNLKIYKDGVQICSITPFVTKLQNRHEQDQELEQFITKCVELFNLHAKPVHVPSSYSDG